MPKPHDPCLEGRSRWHLNSEKALPPEPGAACLAWLLAWEARQESLLRRHEDAMRLQFEALRKEVLRTEGRLPRLPGAVSSPGSSGSSLLNGASEPSPGTPEARMSLTTPEVRMSLVKEYSIRQQPSVRPQPTGDEILNAMSLASPRRSRVAERPQWRIRRAVYGLVHSRCFFAVTCSMIFLYTMAVGLMAELEMRAAVEGRPEPRWLFLTDCSFATYFFAELLLRLFSDGFFYFQGSERNWNIFDACVALSGAADVVLGMEVNMAFFRILRACRVIRVLRVMRFFLKCPAMRDVLLMTESLMSGLPSLFWGLVLLGSLQYIFAVVLLRGAKQELQKGSLSAGSEQVLRESFGGVHTAMLSLTEGISGGRSWGEFAKPFAEVSPIYGLCFPAFMVFLIFGALNILTGVFVESTGSIIKQNRELAVEEEIARAESAEAQIREFFEDLDTDESGTLSREELARGLEDPRVKAYFSAVLQIDAADSQNLFQLLDKDNDGKVSLKEFVQKCTKLRGGARAMDIAVVRKETGLMQKQFNSLRKVLEDVSQKLQKQHAKEMVRKLRKQDVKTSSV